MKPIRKCDTCQCNLSMYNPRGAMEYQDMLEWARKIDEAYKRDYERAKKEYNQWHAEYRRILSGKASVSAKEQYAYWMTKQALDAEAKLPRCTEEGPWHPNKSSLRCCMLKAGHAGPHDNGYPRWRWNVVDGKHRYVSPEETAPLPKD
jgi:hypothetical protein